jgi:hypothetical protein
MIILGEIQINMKQVTLLLLSFFLTIAAFSQTSPTPLTTKEEHAKQLLELTGSAKLGMQVMNNMIASFKTQVPSAPADFWDDFIKEVNTKELLDLMIPIYVRHYTDDELMQLIQFYKSPLGQKVIEKLPLITQDSFVAGQEWGRRIGEKAANRLKDKGYMQ